MDVEHIITSGGILLIGAIVFAESGLLVGFFLPGDTLLFTAGVFAAQDKLPLGWLLIVINLAAVIGDNVGYSLGRRLGARIFKKRDGIFFRQEYTERAEKFYENHGGKTIILARFVPIVRTFAPVVAGVARMPRPKFMIFNIIGALLWGTGVTLAGVFLGKKIPSIDRYVLPAVVSVTLLTFGPALYHLLKEKDTRRRLASKARDILSRILLNKKVN